MKRHLYTVVVTTDEDERAQVAHDFTEWMADQPRDDKGNLLDEFGLPLFDWRDREPSEWRSIMDLHEALDEHVVTSAELVGYRALDPGQDWHEVEVATPWREWALMIAVLVALILFTIGVFTFVDYLFDLV